MKYFAALLLILSSLVQAAEETQTLIYTPNNDVTTHSKIALDAVDITSAIDAGLYTTALDIYSNPNGTNRPGKNFEMMAQLDWAAAGIKDVQDYDRYAALFSKVDGEPYLDKYFLDAINCEGTFAGSSRQLCDMSAKKNLFCTLQSYALYEGVKTIQMGAEKTWDELFAFWNGVYDETVDDRVEAGAPGAVQKSRDTDFGTSFRQDSIQALIDGQKAFVGKPAGEPDREALTKAYNAYKRASVGTWAQATLKYAALFDQETDPSTIDGKWAEGYTYFRCGAGLMNAELAVYTDWQFDPRGKNTTAYVATVDESERMVCKILKKMLAVPEIGYGLQVDDLNLENYAKLSNIKDVCGIESFEHVDGQSSYSSSKSGSERVWIPFLGLLVVVLIYIVGFRKAKRD